MIKAQCHSDDYCVKANFDATPWFEQATYEQISDLAKCEWCNDYPADDVALFMASDEQAHPEVCDMFKYIKLRGRIESIGFECSVDEDDARAWLKANRPNWMLDAEEG